MPFKKKKKIFSKSSPTLPLKSFRCACGENILDNAFHVEGIRELTGS